MLSPGLDLLDALRHAWADKSRSCDSGEVQGKIISLAASQAGAAGFPFVAGSPLTWNVAAGFNF